MTSLSWRLRLWMLRRAAAWCGLEPYWLRQTPRPPKFAFFAQSRDIGTAALIDLADRAELERQRAAVLSASAASATYRCRLCGCEMTCTPPPTIPAIEARCPRCLIGMQLTKRSSSRSSFIAPAGWQRRVQ